jgi:hypothetical protein
MEHSAAALAGGIDAALPGWVERSVAWLVSAWTGTVPRNGGGRVIGRFEVPYRHAQHSWGCTEDLNWMGGSSASSCASTSR